MTENEFAEYLQSFIRPVTFADNPALPWGFGTAFMVEFRGHLYAVTALHVMQNQQANFQDFRFFLKGCRRAVPFNMCSTFTVHTPESEDHSDLIFFRVHRKLHEESGGPKIPAIPLGLQAFPALGVPNGTVVFVAGYPENRIDTAMIHCRSGLIFLSSLVSKANFFSEIQSINSMDRPQRLTSME